VPRRAHANVPTRLIRPVMCSGAARNGRIVVSLAAGPRHHEPLVGDLPAEQGIACLKSLRDHTDAVKATGDRRCRDQITAL
jgi:hypothetical protein